MNEWEARRRYAQTACDAPVSAETNSARIEAALDKDTGFEDRTVPETVFILENGKTI